MRYSIHCSWFRCRLTQFLELTLESFCLPFVYSVQSEDLKFVQVHPSLFHKMYSLLCNNHVNYFCSSSSRSTFLELTQTFLGSISILFSKDFINNRESIKSHDKYYLASIYSLNYTSKILLWSVQLLSIGYDNLRQKLQKNIVIYNMDMD